MTNENDKLKPVVLTPEQYKQNPTWFRAAVGYRLLKILTPKRLSSRLPRVLRTPLLLPGVKLPPGYQLSDPFPQGLFLPPGVWFPPSWIPGDPLPPNFQINTLAFFPTDWHPGNPLPPGLILPPGVIFPPGWKPGDPMPPGYQIDTSAYFPPGWQPGDPPPEGTIPDPDLPSWVTDPSPPWPTDPNFPIPTPPGISPEYNPFLYVTTIQMVRSEDGVIGKTASDWNNAHDAATGDYISTDTELNSDAIQIDHDSGSTTIRRTFFQFDTQSIPPWAVILSASISAYGYQNGGYKTSVQAGTQSLPMTTADFDSFEGEIFDAIVMTEPSNGTYNQNIWTLNAAGLAYLETRGFAYSKFCMRNYELDYQNNEPAEGFTTPNSAFYFFERLEHAERPTITINWKYKES